MYNLAMSRDTRDTGSPPPDILVTGHFKESYGYAVYRSHGSGNWLITYTLQGEGLYRQSGLDIVAQPGDILLLQPGTVHDYSVPLEGAWEFLWAHFQPRAAWLSWWQLPEVGNGLFKIHIHPSQLRERIQQAFLTLHADASISQALQHNWSSNSSNAVQKHAPRPHNVEGASNIIQRELALNRLEEVLLLAVRENAQSHERPLDERVQHILDLITHNFTDQYTIEALAREVSLSPSRLCHLFKQEIGDSITNVILTLRLGQAARLLEFTSYSINGIAEQVGFSSAFYFSRQFHQRFGQSPRDYRATIYAKAQRSK